MSAIREAVLSELAKITDPVAKVPLSSSPALRALTVENGEVRFVLEIAPDQADPMGALKTLAENRLSALDGVTKVSILMTAHTDQKAPPDLKPKRQAAPAGPQKIAGIKNIIAVASGKGGVGKSTVSSNLAVALAAAGKRVGLLDADVYGPSQPKMLGVSKRPASPDGKTIIPLQAHGVTMMSLGLMTKEGEAIIWRGPMLMGALQQMLTQVEWGELDVLVIDLPPGTGDVQMSLAQKTEVTGAIIVSTPQDVALIDARKGINMFEKLKVPILGMIENMSTHICSNCGHEEHVFGHGGVAREAAALGVPLLAEIPLALDIRVASDDGTPIAAQPETASGKAFAQVARQLIAAGHV